MRHPEEPIDDPTPPLLLAPAALPVAAAAQDALPTRPVRLIVPFPPGGATDIIARLYAERLSQRWRQPVVIENRGGGGTMIGTQLVARAAPDGYTFGFVVSAHASNPAIRADVPYDTLRDFSPIGQVARAHVVLVASPSLAPSDLRGVVALSRARDGGLDVATPGVGTVMHMVMELLAAESGARLAHVPFSGGAPAATEVIAGRIPLLIDAWHAVRPQMAAGRMKVIAASSAAPVPGAAELPLMRADFPGVEAHSIVGLVAPAGVPPAIIGRIAGDSRAVMFDPELAPRLSEVGLEPVVPDPEGFSRLITEETARWRRVVRERGLQPI
jgi:tripartite-type tricarboxylate transporter receptor subunit TctC